MKRLKQKNNKNIKKGFTIIELIVAITVFTLAVGSITGIFVAAVRSQVKILATQKLLDETSYIMEYMSRMIRMAKKDVVGACVGEEGGNYHPQWGTGPYIIFLDYHNECHIFDTTGGSDPHMIQEYKESIGEYIDLTSSKWTLSSMFWINVKGASGDPTDHLQPRITISPNIEAWPSGKPEIKIQTTVSQRNLDIYGGGGD